MLYAFLGMLCTSLMVIFDDLMVDGVYKNAKNAIITTTSLGSLFGVVAGLTLWLWGDADYWTNLKTWFWPFGLLTIGCGIALSQFMFHYFRCFYEKLDGTMIASWFAATPIFVYAAAALLFVTGITGELTPFSIQAFVGVLIASLGIVFLERMSSEQNEGGNGYRGPLIWVMVFSIVYILMIDWIIADITATGTEELEVITTLMPLYWTGFAFGVWPVVQKSTRSSFGKRWPAIKQLWKPILCLEIIGMLAFFFEFFGIGDTDPVLVQIIFGLSAVVVWLFSVGMTRLAREMDEREEATVTLLWLPIDRSSLELFELDDRDRWKQITLVIVTLIGVTVFITAVN